MQHLKAKEAPGDEPAYQEYSSRIRLLKGLYELPQRPGAFAEIFDDTFPWIINSEEFLARKHAGSGIVISVGNEFFTTAQNAIKIIRHLNCSLPIHIAYAGVFDLAAANRDRFTGVTLGNLCETFNCTLLDFDRWDSKPFALLDSPFRHTILIDADAVFVKPPERLLDDSGYRDAGALFFYDRTLFAGNFQLSEWLVRILPKPISNRATSLRSFRALSTYEQESGVVAIDKSRHLFGLLMVCWLNAGAVRADVHAFTHGDKETFWIGLEMAREPFEFMPLLPGSIGPIEEVGERGGAVQQICGHLAHFDRDGTLFWFNNGLALSKKESDYGLHDAAVLTHLGREGKWTEGLCVRGHLEPLSPENERLLSSYRNITELDNGHIHAFGRAYHVV